MAIPAGNADGGVTADGVVATAGHGTDSEAADPRWARAERLARSVYSRRTQRATLEAILATALDVCPGISAAGVNLYVRKRFEPQAVLGAAPPELDALQQRSGEGPCIQASREQRLVVIDDTATDGRWTDFCQRAHEMGVSAVACAPLWVDDATLGSLSLYASACSPLGDDVVALASFLATHAALAIANSRRSDNLQLAVDSRDVIGQAKGILMKRFRLSANDAFELLLASSQAARLKVQQVAERLTTTGELPTPTAVPRAGDRS